MKKTYWLISIKNPVNDDIIEQKEFDTIADVAKNYGKIPEKTWRNISVGRSKIYGKFITCEKKTKHITTL